MSEHIQDSSGRSASDASTRSSGASPNEARGEALSADERSLAEIHRLLSVMVASATQIEDGDEIVGYEIKTGALHRLIGLLGVSVPLGLPTRGPVATITTTDAGWRQLRVHGVVIRGVYGSDDLELRTCRDSINAAAMGAAPSGHTHVAAECSEQGPKTQSEGTAESTKDEA
jgi:hypothetical protein